MSEIFLIRHAQASFDAADYDCLSPRGEAQAGKLGAWMAARGGRPGAIFTGTLRRHAQTATLAARAAAIEPPIRVLPGLDELDSDELVARLRPELASREALLAELAASGDPRRAFQALFSAAVARWTSGQADGDYTLAWPAFRAAVLAAWDTLAKESAEEVWVVSSGGPIAVIATLLAGADPQRSFDFAWPLVNTSVSRIRTGRRGAQLVTYNAWPHLDTAADAALVTHR
ncbi:histidine phosphatase family protein [Burkholderia gladioli]|uniref:histidine phosphatase family protein n=1 Tax=Burkholderia gladioli TaxID=28095 RepID=UPI00163E8E4F|nr:histidine phosphatase family protein [Burkholderia gladioli]